MTALHDDQGSIDTRRPWRAVLAFGAFVLSVAGGAWVVGARHRALHGADFFTGDLLDARFPPPTHLRGAGTDTVHAMRWPLAPGSGALDVRFETRHLPRARLVTAVRVTPGQDVLDGVEASVRVIDYDTTTVGTNGEAVPVGHVTLECIERAGDGEHTHRVELRGDGTWVLAPP
jgi:hypothetical protein